MSAREQLQPKNEYLEEKIPLKKARKKKLTPAERKERKLHKEREFKMLEMRDQLRREYEMSKKTARKYRERWEGMCRDVKLKQMKQELEDWEKQVNRIVKQKDEKIELLLDEIATTKDFHRKSFSTNSQMMDFLIGTLKAFQENSYILYEKEASDLLHDFFREADVRSRLEYNMKINCENVVHAKDLLTKKELISDQKIFLDRRDDCVNTEIEKRYRLRDKIVKEMKCLRKQLLEFHGSLKDISLDAQKYEKINFLMERQNTFQTESTKLNNLEERNMGLCADLQKAISHEQTEAKRKLHDLQVEYAFFMRMRKKIENEMNLNRVETHEKLKIVTSESYAVIKKFQKLKKFGELLLSLTVSCRKLQTQSEKVLPSGDLKEPETESINENELFKLNTIDLKSHVDISEEELQRNAQLMSNFWRRQALAEAQVVFLEERKKKLLKENQQYIDAIKRLSKTDNAEDLKSTLTVQKAREYSDLPVLFKFYP